jgi:hypothetical protein
MTLGERAWFVATSAPTIATQTPLGVSHRRAHGSARRFYWFAAWAGPRATYDGRGRVGLSVRWTSTCCRESATVAITASWGDDVLHPFIIARGRCRSRANPNLCRTTACGYLNRKDLPGPRQRAAVY